MRTGAINIKQAAEALGMEPAMLAYQLAGKVGKVVFHFSASICQSQFLISNLDFQIQFSNLSPSQVTSEGLGQAKVADNNGGYEEDPLPISYEDEDYNEEMMEVQPDIILEGQEQEPEQFDSIVEEEGVDPIQS